MKKAVAYYRVSSQKQGVSGLGLEAQKSSVEAYAKATGHEIVETFTEVETGTSKRDRVEIYKAIATAKEQGAVLLIGKLDRLARSVSFISNLMDSGVDFVAVDMPDANRLTVHIMSALAEHEARLISVRTKDALTQVKARGKRLGSPENPTQDAREQGAKANQEKAEEFYRKVAPYIHTLKEQGLSYRKIAKRLNDEGHRTRQGKQWAVSQVQNVIQKYGNE